MIVQCQWLLWCITRTESKALKLLNLIERRLQAVAADVHCHADADIPGYAVYFTTTVEGRAWAEIVLTLIDSGYRAGKYWTVLPGVAGRTVYESAEGFSDECFESGVRRIQWHVENPGGNGTGSQ